MAKITLNKSGLAKAVGTLTVYNYGSMTDEFIGVRLQQRSAFCRVGP